MIRKNIKYLKKSIVDVLVSNTELEGLLGAAGRIHHQSPTSDQEDVAVTYRIISDADSPYDEDTDVGRITEDTVEILTFDTDSKTERSDDIHALIKEILTNKLSLTSEYIICYSSIRISQSFQRRDEENEKWITGANYRITWAQREDATLDKGIVAAASVEI